MNSIIINSKEVKDIIKATFSEYRKRKVAIYPSIKVMFSDLNWSGGTRSEYKACTIEGNSIESKYDMSMPHPWNNPFEGVEINLPEGIVIVEGGYFCGEKRRLRIYVHPSNMPKLITGDKNEIL